MARNDRRDDEVRGGLGTLTRSQPGPRPRSREDGAREDGARENGARDNWAQPAAPDVAAPAPRRGRQARDVPPQRTTDGQRAGTLRRPPADPPADAPRAAGRRGMRLPGTNPRGADPRGADPRGAGPRGAGPRRADPRRADPRRGDQPGDPRGTDPRGADPRRGGQPGTDPRTRGPRNGAVPGRPGAPARTGQRPADQAPPAGAPWRVAPPRRRTGPQPAPQADPQAVSQAVPQTLPQTGPRQDRGTGPQPAGREAREPRAFAPGEPDQAPEASAQPTTVQPLIGPHRMPFVLLLCGLLGGALVSALVISTTLAAGSFEITRLQESTSTLTKQQQALEQQVAQAKSAEVIAERASELGMRPAGLIQFINLKTGKTLNDHNTGALANVQYPGYTP
jgi:hypothetical protein